MPKPKTTQPRSRSGERRKPLTEKEFRSLIETGKASEKDRRAWEERRKK